MDFHFDKHGLLESEQRGVRTKCSKTMKNLMIGKMVCQDSRNPKRNISMAWIDVKKAFDSVSHEWLVEMMRLVKFSAWMCETVATLCKTWNAGIAAMTKQGRKTSDIVRFSKGLPLKVTS